MNTKRLLTWIGCGLLVLAILLGTLFGIQAYQAAQRETTLTILHTNDLHGRMLGNGENIVGLDRIAGLYETTPNALLLDAGDTVHGLPFATLQQGEDVIALMNAAGYSAMTVGNHDLNYGPVRLQELAAMANFPVLAANLRQNGAPLTGDITTVTIDGIRIGILGVTTQETLELAMPSKVAGMSDSGAIAAAKDCVARLKQQKVDLIVALVHMGVDARGTAQLVTSQQLANEVDGIDLIIDGHSHTALEQGIIENNILIAQTGGEGSAIGKIELQLKGKTIVSASASLIDTAAAQSITPSETVLAMMNTIAAAQDAVLREVVAVSASAPMSSARAPGVRTQEMPLGNLVADAYRAMGNADISVANGGDIRADLPQGDVTKGNLISILPYGNALLVKEVTPAILKAALENGVSGMLVGADGNIDHEASAQGRFPQISGFSFTYNPAEPAGSRVQSIVLDDGTALDLNDDTTVLRFCGSEYILGGGDYYDMLAPLPVVQTLCAADEALLQYLQTNTLPATPKLGRIFTVS